MPAPLFEPRLALASLSGESDAHWARAASDYAGCAFLGGVALDADTRDAARAMVARGRDEFLPADPLAFVDRQLAALDDAPLRAAVNVRSTTLDPLREASAVCADHGAVLEVNAHCRQEEMSAVGAGERLLCDPDRLCERVRAASEGGAPVSVKVRTEVDGVDLPRLAGRVEAAGASAVHVDAMDSEHVVADVRDSCDLFLVANNGVRDRATAHEYLRYGADAVSVGRPSDDPAVLARVHDAVTDWFDGAGERGEREAEEDDGLEA